MKKYFYPPKGGWPTNVMVPSERVALVTARLRGKPIPPPPFSEWRTVPQLPRHVLKMNEAILEGMKKGIAASKAVG